MRGHRHDEVDCECVKYRPDKIGFGKLRSSSGENMFCAQCGRLVSKKKWKGGIKKDGWTKGWISKLFCPCCGSRMRKGRRDKADLVRTIEDQIKNPQNYTRYIQKTLPKKKRLLERNLLVPRVQ